MRHEAHTSSSVLPKPSAMTFRTTSTAFRLARVARIAASTDVPGSLLLTRRLKSNAACSLMALQFGAATGLAAASK